MKAREGFNRPERMLYSASLSAASAGLAGASSTKSWGCLLSLCVCGGGPARAASCLRRVVNMCVRRAARRHGPTCTCRQLTSHLPPILTVNRCSALKTKPAFVQVTRVTPGASVFQEALCGMMENENALIKDGRMAHWPREWPLGDTHTPGPESPYNSAASCVPLNSSLLEPWSPHS